MTRTRFLKLGGLGAALLCIVVVSMLCRSHGTAIQPANQGPIAARSASAQPRSTPAPTTTQPSVLVLPAMIVPDEQVEVYAKTSGYVSEITVDIGSRVRRGQTIIQLSVPELTDDLHHAEATLATKSAKANEAALLVDSAKSDEQRYVAEHELAEITLKRKTELFEGKAIPPQEFDVAKSGADLARAQVAVSRAKIAAAEGALQAARSDVVMAESDLARVKTLIDYTYVKSPFDGVVTHRGVDHGTFVRSAAQGGGAPLLTIDKTDVVRVVVDVPEADAPRVHVGTPVSIELRSAGGLPIDATITRSAQAIRADTRTMRTEIDLQNADGKLVPGIYAKVAIRLEAAPFKVAGGPP